MKTKPNKSLSALLRTLDLSQDQFATLTGATRQRIADLINGRGAAIRPGEIQMVRAAFGAEVSKPGRVTTCGGKPYTKKFFENWQKTYGRNHSEKAAQGDVDRLADSLLLLLLAAGSENKRTAVQLSFIQWCEQAAESFKLLPALNQQLSKRAWKKEIHRPRFQHLTVSRPVPNEPGKRSFVVVNPDKPFTKTGEKEFVPRWCPGLDMRPNALFRDLVAVERVQLTGKPAKPPSR